MVGRLPEWIKNVSAYSPTFRKERTLVIEYRIVRWLARHALSGVLLCGAPMLWGQSDSGTIVGVVADPSDAVVPNATVTVRGANNLSTSALSNGEGRFTVPALQPGEYTLLITAKGFLAYETTGLRLAVGETITHKARLQVASLSQEVTVDESRSTLDVEPSNNAGAVVIVGSDLSALSDDPDELAADLQALAGPAAGPSGGEMFIDGFSGGKLPPKASIREIRINQNPFSAEYDRLGFGRIEIFTKPGTDRFRGEAFFNFGDSIFNARNPFALEKPASQRRMFEGNIAGQLNKRSSFMIGVERRDMEETTIINALTLDPSFKSTPFRVTVVTPAANTELNTRLDYQLSASHTLVGRFDWENRTQRNAGLDTFSLPSRAINYGSRERLLQLTETAILNTNAINEIRFQYRRASDTSDALSFEPAVQVPDAFSSGGSAVGASASAENRWEVADMVSWARNRHTLKFGGRIRAATLSDTSGQNYNGAFTFSSLDSYRLTKLGLRDGLIPEQIRMLGGGASQFSITAGDPMADVGQIDAGLFLQDDWRIHRRLTLTAGLRYEVQNNIQDRLNIAPRVAFAWAPGRNGGGSTSTVIRGGFGMFYDRVNQGLTLQARRLDGRRQTQYMVPNPDFFPTLPPVEVLASNRQDQAVRVMDHNLRAPYTAQYGVSIERRLPKNTTLSITYAGSRGVRMLRSRNINSPLIGTYDPLVAGSGIRPFNAGSIYSYESTGLFRQHQFIANLNARMNRRFNLFGYYVWSRANSDSDGAGSFPGNPYSYAGEYERAGFDIRHRIFVGGSIEAPYRLILNPFVTASSGAPFNLTIGRDLNGDSIFNDRPAWATDLTRPTVIRTSYGIFDQNPMQSQTTIPRNLGDGPAQFTVNLRVSKSFSLGDSAAPTVDQAGGLGGTSGAIASGTHAGGQGGHGWAHANAPSSSGRYSVTVSASARNLLNAVNPALPVGNLSSPVFGASMATAGRSAANRTIEFQVRFSF